MLLARNSWLRYGSAVFILALLFLVAYEHGIWNRIALVGSWPGQKSSSSITAATLVKSEDSTILNGVDTGKGSKMVVMGRTKKGDTTWVHKELPDWQSAIYTVNDPLAPLRTPINKGREAMAYLTFIIENYDRLPEIIAFQHAHHNGTRRAWHVEDPHNPDHNNAVTLQHLRLPYIQEVGFANLRCIPSPGCHGEVRPNRDPPLIKLDKDGNVKYRVEHAMPEALRYMFGEDFEIPKEIGTACCAQFAVSRERVLMREKASYERIRQWIIETELRDYFSGRVLEYMWHIIFGMPSVNCPGMRVCNCNLYGIGCDKLKESPAQS